MPIRGWERCEERREEVFKERRDTAVSGSLDL